MRFLFDLFVTKSCEVSAAGIRSLTTNQEFPGSIPSLVKG